MSTIYYVIINHLNLYSVLLVPDSTLNSRYGKKQNSIDILT